MKNLIIYDNTGYIIIQMGGNYRVPQGGIQFLEVELPENKRPISVDVEKKQVIFEDLPKTDIEVTKERIEALEQSNAELISLIAMDKKNV